MTLATCTPRVMAVDKGGVCERCFVREEPPLCGGIILFVWLVAMCLGSPGDRGNRCPPAGGEGAGEEEGSATAGHEAGHEGRGAG
jgi:hypothetical protein